MGVTWILMKMIGCLYRNSVGYLALPLSTPTGILSANKTVARVFNKVSRFADDAAQTVASVFTPNRVALVA